MFGRNNNRDGEKIRCKSNQRRKLKSPIRIKDKIKQLEEKLEKEANFKKQKPHEKFIQSPEKDHSPKQEEYSPFRKTIRRYEIHSSERPHGNSLFSSAHQPIFSKRTSEKEDR